MNCLHCTAPVTNGLALCDICQRKALLDLEFLPVYFRNLARWRPGRAGARPVPGSRVLYDGTVPGLGTGDRISDTLDETLTELLGWACVLVEDRPYLGRLLDRLNAARRDETLDDAQSAAWLCKGFERHLISVATLEWCGEFVRQLGVLEERLRMLTESAVPGWYAGCCRRDSCGHPTYVVPGLTWVTCRECGLTTHAQDHLDIVLEEARGWVDRPMRLAEALVALLDNEPSVPRLHKRISKWGERGQILVVRRLDADGDEIGPKRFRLGEVLDQLRAEGQTRQSGPLRAHAS